MHPELKEPALPDDYPVYAGYYYVADGLPIPSPISGDVAHLKREIGASQIRRCDIAGRQALAAAAPTSETETK